MRVAAGPARVLASGLGAEVPLPWPEKSAHPQLLRSSANAFCADAIRKKRSLEDIAITTKIALHHCDCFERGDSTFAA
jgi:hypothetical protein